MRNVTKSLKTLMLFTVSMFIFVSFGFAQQTILLTESFESAPIPPGTTPPAGWAIEQVTGTTLGVTFVTSSTTPTISAAYDGTKFVRYNSYSISSGSTRLKTTAPVSTINKSFIMVDFAWYEDPGYSSSADKVDVQWSTDGILWNTAGTFNRYNAVAGWKGKNVVLPVGAANQAALYVAFLFTSAWGNNCAMDLVHITAGPPPPPALITIGTGTSAVGWPYYTFYWSSRTQMLYTAAELTAGGAVAGPLYSIGFNIITRAAQTMSNFAVKLGHTTATTIPAWVAGLTSYYTTAYTVPATGWQDITLTTPFIWDGTSNVIVEVCFANSSYTSNSTVNGTLLTNMFRHYHADNSTGCAHTTIATYTPAARPNIRFGVPPITPGVLMGYVRNINTLAPIPGAIVVVGAKRDTARANGMYVIYNIPPGAVTANTTAAGYIASSTPATIVGGVVTSLDILMEPGPKVGGVVTDASTGAPITGATIRVAGTIYTMTVAGGTYLSPLLSIVGSQTIEIAKSGYDSFTGTVNLVANTTTTQDAALLPTAVQPGPFTAALNGPPATLVNLNWGVPQGLYQLIYDDGVQDNFAIWANANNLNALKFTPMGWPAKLVGGKVNLGVALNYPANALPLTKFMMFACKADGAGGVPGTLIDSVEITPTGFGWADFSFPVPIIINSGDFYLVMRQGGIPPHAAGLGVDLTTTNLRSWSRFVTGGAPWVPAAGNFMIRAIMQGTGGPMLGDNFPTDKELITASAPNGLLYETPVATQTGYEGVSRTEPFEWSTMQNTSTPFETGLTPYTNTNATGGATDIDLSGNITQAAVYTPAFIEAPMAVLFDNGPVFNSTGTGAGGANESIYYQGGTGTYGSGCQQASGIYDADDFAVSGNAWNVSSIEFYSYQSNSPGTASTITGVYVRIWNGKPGVAGSTVAWGDMTTNRLGSTTFANIYRVLAANGGVARPIMKVIANTPGLTLNAGNYWVEYGCTGSLASGPWMPPVVTANNVTGNAIQTVDAGVSYVDILYNTYGQGLPFIINGTQATSSNMSYQVWRLQQGQEGDQTLWTSLWTGNVNSTVDNGWPSLATGAYRWAVKAIYTPPGQRFSAPTFSNVIGKNWIANANVCITLTCAANAKAGTKVKLTNTAYPDTNYTKITDTSGCVHFTNVWKGSYTVTATRFSYPVYTQNVTIMGDVNLNITLLQETKPVTNLAVNDQTLKATWSPPRTNVVQLLEPFTNFTANQWVISGGTNWTLAAFGNPSPSAQFNWTPNIYNYNEYLTSKSLAGINAPVQRLKYDIYLSTFGPIPNTMAVELWNGTTWTVLKSYDNSVNIPWKKEDLDISSVSGNPAFKIRFHAAGEDSYDINNWNIDNVQVYSTDGTSGTNPCVIGYNFYLNGVLSGFVADTTYNIPPGQVIYGQTYQACVKAVYGSGYSPQLCVSFTAHFLYPARDLTAINVPECNAYLSWKKPVTSADGPDVPAFDGVVEHTPAYTGMAPKSPLSAVVASPTDQPLGSNAFGIDMTTRNTINFDVNNIPGMTVIAPIGGGASDFWHDLEFPANTTDFAYAIRDASDHLYKVVRATGAFTDLGSMGNGTGANQLLDLAIDGSNGDIYAVSSNLSADLFWKINPAVPSATLIGPCVSAIGTIGLAGDKLGNIWGYDLVGDNFFSFNKTTGLATLVGSIGFNANYGQCMFFDETVSTITMACYNASVGAAQIRAVNTTTGASVVLSQTPDQIGGATLPVTIAGGGGATPPGLIGYIVYRNGDSIHYNPHPDSITYYNYNLAPASYKYDVKARYDLSVPPYGMPAGTKGLSLGNTAGIQTVNIICGRPLPFYEPWDLGSFTFNNWSFEPSQGHWSINSGIGNPAPSADFVWSPAIIDYETALVSPAIDATPWNCAKIWMDVDVKLVDYNNTGKEKLTIDLYYNSSWHQKLELSNNGSTDWLPKHLDISDVKGKAFKIRFNATGENSADILHWYVDNIHIYGICTPASALHATQSHFATTLTWTSPVCASGGGGGGTPFTIIWDDGTYESGFTSGAGERHYGNKFPLTPGSSGILTSFDVMFNNMDGSASPIDVRMDVYDATHSTLLGSSALFMQQMDVFQNILVPSIPFTGQFYGMIYMNNVGIRPYYNSLDTDGPNAYLDYGTREQAGVWQTIGEYGGTPGVFLVRANGMMNGKDFSIMPGQNPDSKPNPNGNTSEMAIGSGDSHSHPAMGLTVFNANSDNPGDSSVLNGYNVYRTNELGVNFAKLNANLITDTTYVDTYPSTLVSGNFKYYVTTLYKNSVDNSILCESPSDTILVTFPAVGINELNNGQIMIYPNPATEVINVKSNFTITRIDVMNFVGQTIYTNSDVAMKTAKINVVTFKSGVYFVKVSTSEGVRTVKITVTH